MRARQAICRALYLMFPAGCTYLELKFLNSPGKGKNSLNGKGVLTWHKAPRLRIAPSSYQRLEGKIRDWCRCSIRYEDLYYRPVILALDMSGSGALFLPPP